ncbi:hypothetical protein Taro_004142 [Colocasia esculenta]|uniref:Uncharacterized protein n=1 Tax=Colocasia esculenta TaxID=4460 RepID=A0A843TL94_COLES|nr:hypothetical protein [Colocasia esculenta]
MRAAAADQAGNDGLKGGIRGKLLGFRRDLRVLRLETLEVPGMDLQPCVCRCGVGVEVVVVWCDLPLVVSYRFMVGYPRFFVSQARVFVVLGVCPGTVWYRRGVEVVVVWCDLPLVVSYRFMVGCPRFSVSQAVSSGLCPDTCVVPSRSVSSDLDTLTPLLEVYVRLRER